MFIVELVLEFNTFPLLFEWLTRTPTLKRDNFSEGSCTCTFTSIMSQTVRGKKKLIVCFSEVERMIKRKHDQQ